MRRYIVAGNWKMHKTAEEAVNLALALIPLVSDVRSVEVVLCPPFTALPSVGEVLNGSGLFLGAQNMHHEPQGAYTGEISASMLLPLGVSHVILGHSERRHYFIESDPQIREKVGAALQAGLTPILCVGETLAEREAGETESVVSGQLEGCLEGIELAQAEDLVVAYEPVWAIGTGKTATLEQAQEVHALIRAKLTQFFGVDLAGKIRIQYGGSVKPENAAELMAQPDIDGALVGGASLDADSFAAIVRSV
ncbi:MAG: triose-phosphate isomerase [Candidatus Latescibacteria bacterium]|nr:triose-phosphate isomerase [Candidatus Latescibacterota bacterium]